MHENMTLDVATLETLRRQHPAWRLLVADWAPLVASFLHRVFVQPNVRSMPQAELAEAYPLRIQVGRAACCAPCGDDGESEAGTWCARAACTPYDWAPGLCDTP